MPARFLFIILFCSSLISYAQLAHVDSLLDNYIRDNRIDKLELYHPINAALEKIPFQEADDLLKKKLATVTPFSYNALEIERLRSVVYYRNNKFVEALPIIRHSLEIARQLNNKIAIGNCNMDAGFYYRDAGFYSYSAEHLREASEIFASLNMPRETGVGYYNTALTSYQAGNPEQSLAEQKLSEYYLLQIPLKERTPTDGFYFMSGYNTMGLSYKRLHKYDSALIYLNRADSIAHKTNNSLWIKLLGGNKGEVYFLMGDFARAYPLFKADYDEMLKQQDQINLLYAAGFNLAEIFLQMNQVDSAARLLNSLEKHDIPKPVRERFWKIKSMLQEKKKDFAGAAQSLRYVITIQDSARINNEAYNISALKTIYELERKDESIRNLSRNVDEQRARLRQQNLIIIAGIAILLLLTALVITFYLFNRKRKEQVEIIGEQKDEIEEQNVELESQSETLREANRRVEEMNVNLEGRIRERTQALQEAIAQLNNYLYRSSHDLRRPLTTVIGLAKLNRSGQVDQQQIIDMMEKTAYTLDRMLKKMQMAHDLEQELTTQPERIDVGELIQKIRTSLLSDAENKKIQFTVETGNESPVLMSAHRHLVEIVLFNIIENAVVFANENEFVQPHITAHMVQTNDSIIITITDNGIGFHDDIRTRIFEQFFRGSEKSRGSGLGLFLVKKAIEKLQAKVELESEPFQGTRVTLTIPKNDG